MPIHAPFLKYFREVANCGSVRMAAKQLHISSSAVNRQILKMEDELGTDLFYRTSKGMKLTSAGLILAEHVNRTLSDEARCLSEISALSGHSEKPLAIAAQESVITDFLPPVLVRLYADYPQVASSFKAAGGNDLIRLLQERAADVAIVFDGQSMPNTETIASRQLPVGAIVRPDHPLAHHARVSMAECAEYPLILPDQSWPLRQALDEQLQQFKIEPRVTTSSNSIEFLRSMINHQQGVGFQTAVGIEQRLLTGELKLIPLCNPEPVYQNLSLFVPTGSTHSKPLAHMLDLLVERLNSYADQWS